MTCSIRICRERVLQVHSGARTDRMRSHSLSSLQNQLTARSVSSAQSAQRKTRVRLSSEQPRSVGHSTVHMGWLADYRGNLQTEVPVQPDAAVGKMQQDGFDPGYVGGSLTTT